MTPATEEEVFTIPQLADRLGVSAQAVRDWISKGRIEEPDKIPATGERVYSKAAAERIERDYMRRAARGETRGPGAAERRQRALEWHREAGIPLEENGGDETGIKAKVPDGSPAAVVTREVGEWLVLEDELLAVAPLVVAVANRLSGPPVWLMIIAPPSSGKSVVIRGLTEGVVGARHISSITANTFASGMMGGSGGDGSRSLLERMKQRGEWLLTIKDFGTIQNQKAEERQEIFGQLREIYDGKFDATYGTGVEVEWEGNLGILVGATPAVDRKWQWSAQLGERFVHLRPSRPDDEQVARAALQAASESEEQRNAICDAYSDAIEHVYERINDLEAPPELSDGGTETVVAVARFLAEARRPVQRTRGGGGHQVQPAEGPGRLSKIFAQVYQAALLCYDGSEDCARRCTARIAVDSVPGRRGRMLRELPDHTDGIKASTAAKLLGCDTETARRELTQLEAIGLVEKSTPAMTQVFKPADKLFQHAQSIFREAKNGQEALEQLGHL